MLTQALCRNSLKLSVHIADGCGSVRSGGIAINYVLPLLLVASYYDTRNPAVAGMADRTAPVVKLTRQKIVIPSGIGLAAVLAVGQLCLSL